MNIITGTPLVLFSLFRGVPHCPTRPPSQLIAMEVEQERKVDSLLTKNLTRVII